MKSFHDYKGEERGAWKRYRRDQNTTEEFIACQKAWYKKRDALIEARKLFEGL